MKIKVKNKVSHKHLLLLGSVFILLVSCQTTKIINETFLKTEAPLELLQIVKKKGLIDKRLDSKGFVNYEDKIRISIESVEFDSASYKKFRRQHEELISDLEQKKDSVSSHLKFQKVSLLDKVEVINQLNTDINKNIKQYLEHNKSSRIVTSIAVIFSNKDLEKINNADELYLVQTDHKAQMIEIIKKGNVDHIYIPKDLVFAAKISKVCWKGERNKLIISDIIDHQRYCSEDSYSNPRNVENTIDLSKF